MILTLLDALLRIAIAAVSLTVIVASTGIAKIIWKETFRHGK